MKLYEASRVYTSITRLIIVHNFVFMICSFLLNELNSNLVYKIGLSNGLVPLQPYTRRRSNDLNNSAFEFGQVIKN
jgi:hypothetical protein